jgi:transposase
MAAERKKALEQKDLVCLKLVRAVTPFCRALDRVESNVHGNTVLGLTDTLLVLLAGFFNPMVRSLRPVEHLSQMPWAAEHLGGKRVCRSTLSDALARFDPEQLKPVIDGLMKQIPHLARRDGDLEQVCRKIIAADGSTFALAADVAWAMIHQRGGKDPRSHGTCRLNLQLCVDSFTPVDLSVSGSDEGGEAAAFARRILPEVTYLFDRNFVHFGLINRVLEQGSDLVLRLRKDTGFAPVESRLLGAKDVAAKVQSDRVGTLPGSPGGRTGPPPAQLMREVIVDGDDGKPLRLITNLLDLPAHVIAALYRRRWQVELFFRWLKVWAGFEHLISHSKKGVTFQFYVAVIGCLLMHVRTGRKVNKYAIFLFGQVAAGLTTLEHILPMLEKIEHEKELERRRLAKKKTRKQLCGAAAKMPVQ